MSETERETCRKAAAECVALARATADPAKKEILLLRAQEWIKLAYARSDEDFQRLLASMNNQQMTAPIQRQPMQQAQTKSRNDDETG